eukprot:GABV01005937.1.p1 GENE.GABV01005937.1~~GABV01005937.1.p1  ORF type:complete len:105 (+),score=22.56 GABV01005937.1:61-375(+)
MSNNTNKAENGGMTLNSKKIMNRERLTSVKTRKIGKVMTKRNESSSGSKYIRFTAARVATNATNDIDTTKSSKRFGIVADQNPANRDDIPHNSNTRSIQSTTLE